MLPREKEKKLNYAKTFFFQLEILRGSDLNTITTKFVRRSLEKQLGASLDPIKKDINDFIEEIFVDFQEKQEERTKQYLALVVKKEEQKEKKVPVVNNTVKKEKGNKVEKKTTTKKSKKEPGEKRQVNWPVYKIKSPLKEVIDSELVSQALFLLSGYLDSISHNYPTVHPSCYSQEIMGIY